MKRWLILLFCLLMALALTACGGKTATPAPEATTAPAETEAPAATPAPTAEPEEDASGTNAAGGEDSSATDAAEAPAGLPEEEEAGPVLDEEQLAAARACIGRSVDELYAAIGEPTGGTQYATSCVEDYDEDGTLLYEGFYVWTNRSADGETVRDVNPM